MSSGATGDAIYADLLDALSPVTRAGLDPDEARADRVGTMRTLMGDAPQPKWFEAQNNAPPQPGLSPNGNVLPTGLNSRQPSQAAPAAAPPTPVPTGAMPGGVTPSGTPTADPGKGKQLFSPADAPGTTVAMPDAQSTWEQLQRKNVLSGMSSLDKGDQDLDTMRAQPDLETLTAPLERQRVSAQQRQTELANPYDPKTGKLLDEYRPNFATRMMRGVDGFARSGVLGVVDPAIGGGTAYGAPNKQLAIDQAQAAGRVAGANQQLQNTLANWKARNDRMKAQATETRAQADARKGIATEISSQEGVPINQERADAEKAQAYNTSPEGKTDTQAQEYAQRVKQADQQSLKGQNRTLYLANGKIPDPRQATADEIAMGQATAAWHRDNPGKQPGLEDIRNIRAAASGSDIKGQAGRPIPPAQARLITAAKDKAMKVAQDTYNSVDKSGFVINSKSGHVGEKYGKDDFIREMNEAQSSYEEAIEAAGGTVNHMEMGDDLSWKAAATPPAPPAPLSNPKMPPPPPRVGEARKGYVFVGGDPSDPTAWKRMPPASLLASHKEGDVVYGRGGEAFKKVNGTWIAQ